MKFPILTVLLFLPLVGALIVAATPKDAIRSARLFALGTSLATLGVAVAVLVKFDKTNPGFQMTQAVRWIPSSGAAYRVGIDGISLWMVLLTAFLTPLALLASWNVAKRPKAFNVIVLVLETGMLGVFLALDLLLFYVFWEGMLIPMYFLIGLWGYERRVYAAVKFFIYTLAGSLLMIVGILVLYFVGGNAIGERTFDLSKLIGAGLSVGAQKWMFAAFFASFAIKVPIFPFHTWLPDAHTEAPTAGSVLLAGVLLKMGAYGFLRFSIPLFPDAARAFAPALATLGVIGIVYGGVVSIVQRDLKRLIAYSSVSHLGFVVLGIAALGTVGTSGSVLQMLNHGLSTGALFLLVGMLYDRAHTRQIDDFGGMAKVMPVYSGIFLLVALSSLGLPGLNGFVGEFLILNGSFSAFHVLTIVGASGVVLAAIYLLWAYERVFTGAEKVPHGERRSHWRDLRVRELAALAPIVAAILFVGIYPKPVLERIEPSVARMVSYVDQSQPRLAEIRRR